MSGLSKRTMQWTVGLLLFSTSLLAVEMPAPALQNEPIAYIGHGQMFDAQGRAIPVTPDFLRDIQQYYLDALYQQADQQLRQRIDNETSRLFKGRKWSHQDELLAKTELILWLLDEVNPRNGHEAKGKINLVRRHLGKHLAGAEKGQRYQPPKALQELLQPIRQQRKQRQQARGFSTMLSGQAYIDECAANGVPIPPDWGSNQWQHVGNLSDAQEFISQGAEARVYKYASNSTEGACIALPRVTGSDIVLLGIICLGKQTGKACFWDNQQNDVGFDIPVGASMPLSNFAGGAELFEGSGGTCTSCHAGENPYVLHPGTPLGMPALGTLQVMADVWYDPLVHPQWPQNAGPDFILDTVPSTGQCTSCHVQGNAGRFPKISTLINGGYCNAVLNNAVTRTMPIGNPGDPAYAAHVTALQNQCGASPSPMLRVDSVLDFKEVELGFAFKKAVVIHNDGDAALTVSATITTPASDPMRDQWSELNEITPVIIQPGGAPVVLQQVYEPDALGDHSIQMQVSSDDPSTPTQNITFTGSGVAPIPLDTVLVLDRSGSMKDPAGDRKKIDAMRDAAMLYTDLLREDVGGTGTGDKLGFVKYNDSNSVYMALDLITNAKKNAIEADQLSNSALTQSNKLKPEGTTGIGGAMQTAAGQVGGALTDRKQVMVVLTDGIENEKPYISEVLGGIESGNDNLQLYSVGLGFDIEPTKLQNITNMGTGGYHQVSGELTEENLFDLETFYFKIFANATGMDLVVDPTHAISLLTPDPIIVDTATIISSDRHANFLVLDDPVLRAFYDLEFVSPTGVILKPGASVGGIPIQEMSRHTYKVYRVVFPDLSQETEYVGNWILRLTPNGKWSREAVKNALAESSIQHSGYISPYSGLVPIGFAAAVASNYQLDVQLMPSSYLPGADVRMTGSLSDRGWPAVQGKIDVTITSPNDTAYQLALYDDGTHGDSEAHDGTWTNHFQQTGVAGVYKFLFQSIGQNERGELAPREASRYLTLQQPEGNPRDDDERCIPCLLLRLLIIFGLMLLIAMWYCCCYRKRG